MAILFLLLGAAYFASTEIALASVNRIRMMSLADNGDRRARRVLYILDHFDKALTTLLVGNNIMHIACASISTLMATKLWGVGSVAAMTVIVTFAVFLLGEMLPKRFAKAEADRFSMAVSASLIAIMKFLTPVTYIFTKLGAWVTGPFKKESDEPTVTEDELYDIIETVAAEGALDEEKTELVQSALEFSDTFSKDVLTPWDRVVTVNTAMTPEEIVRVIRENAHSRLPVLDREGNIIGLLQIRKYLKAYLAGGAKLINVMDDVHFIADDIPIDDLLPIMSENRTHFSVVLSQSGATLGVVTMEDILEELVGEIYDEDDREGCE